mgnify:CR=1 FL=1
MAEQTQSTFDLRGVLDALRLRWWIVLVTTLVAVFAVFAQESDLKISNDGNTVTVTKTYEAKIETSALQIAQVDPSSVVPFPNFDNQVGVLRSAEVLAEIQGLTGNNAIVEVTRSEPKFTMVDTLDEADNRVTFLSRGTSTYSYVCRGLTPEDCDESIDAFVENKEQFGRSFVYATIATLLALAIAYPLAYAIALKGGKLKNFMLILVIAPFFTSFLLRTVAWKQILGEEGFVVPTLRTIGIISDSTTLTSTSFAVVMGMTYNFLPFMTLPLYASIDRIDPRTLEASGDLYANGFTTFRRVTLPLSMPGVVAGTLLTFIPAAGDYVNAAILGSPNTKMIGNVIESRYLKIVDYPTAAALSFTLMVVILILVTVYVRKAGTEELV